MKIRGGFVSNSSTMSFIIIGVEVPWQRVREMQVEAGVDSEADWQWRDAFQDHFDCHVQGYPESEQRIGVFLYDGEPDGEISEPLAAVGEAMLKAAEICSRLGLEGEIKMYHGEYSTEEY